jgi:hypothetical protein
MEFAQPTSTSAADPLHFQFPPTKNLRALPVAVLMALEAVRPSIVAE